MLRSLTITALGPLTGQFVSLLLLPVIARQYGPDETARWAVVQATALLFGSIGNLRLDTAVALPRSTRRAGIVWWSGVAASLITTIMCICFGPLAKGMLGLDGLLSSYELACMLGAGTAAISILAMFNGLALRNHQFRLIASSQSIIAIVGSAIQLLWPSLFRPTFAGLFWGGIVGQICGVILMAWGCYLTFGLPPGRRATPRLMLCSISRFRRFPMYSVPFTLFGTARDRAYVLVMDHQSSGQVVGTTALLQRVVNFPAGFLSSVIRPVIFAHAARHGVRAVNSRVLAIVRLLLLLGTPFLAVTILYADLIATAILGPEWPESGRILSVLVWPAFTFTLSNWADRLLDVTGHQRLLLWLEACFSSIAIGALALMISLGFGFLGALTIFAFVLVAYNIAVLFITFRICCLPFSALARSAACAAGIFVGFGVGLSSETHELLRASAVVVFLLSACDAYRIVLRDIRCLGTDAG